MSASHPRRVPMLACLLLWGLAGCASLQGVGRSPSTAVAVKPDYGAVVFAARNPLLTVSAFEAVPITADNHVDPTRPSVLKLSSDDYTEDSIGCYAEVQICFAFDVPPGRYYLRSIGWSDGMLVLTPSPTAVPAGGAIPAGATTFTVEANAITSLGSFAWSGEPATFPMKGIHTWLKQASTPFSYERIPDPDESLSLRILLQLPNFPNDHKEWLDAVKQRIAVLAPMAAHVYKPVPVKWPQSDFASPDKYLFKHAGPLNADYGIAIIDLRGPGFLQDLMYEAVDFNGEFDKTREIPEYRMLKPGMHPGHYSRETQTDGTLCFVSITVCVTVDLAPGRYSLMDFSVSNVTNQMPDSPADGNVYVTVSPANLSFAGTYDVSYESHFFSGSKFGMHTESQPDEKLILQELLMVGDIDHELDGWMPMIRTRLDRLSRAPRPASPAPAKPAAKKKTRNPAS